MVGEALMLVHWCQAMENVRGIYPYTMRSRVTAALFGLCELPSPVKQPR